MDWSKYPNFAEQEFRCQHTRKCEMDPEFMKKLQALRTEYGHPMVVTSGYRDASHPVEAKKPSPGYHAKGLAADIACHGGQGYKIVQLAMKHGFTGIGVSQRYGQPRFIHLDTRPGLGLIYGY